MLKHLISLNLLVGLGLLALTTYSNNVYARASASADQPIVYIAHENPMQQVEDVLAKARKTNKLALLVLGAQWCHDSRGFAQKFHDIELQDTMNSRFETVFIDVGYYKDLREVTQRFGQAHYYATPTVLVVDPVTELLINGDTLQIWGMADSVSMGKYKSYFSSFDPNNFETPIPIGAAYKAQISMFEQLQAQRLMDAYKQLVPGMLAEDEKGKATDKFINQWQEVRGFRSQLQKDIQSLYKQARENAPLPLELPNYDAFSWNTK